MRDAERGCASLVEGTENVRNSCDGRQLSHRQVIMLASVLEGSRYEKHRIRSKNLG